MLIKRMAVFLFCLLTLVLAACQSTRKPFLVGEFVLYEAFLGEEEITAEFQVYRIIFFEDFTMQVFSSSLGMIVSRSSRYSIEGNTIIETDGQLTFLYRLNQDKTRLELHTEEFGSDLRMVFVKILESSNGQTGVLFTSILFGDPISMTKKFNYAPAVIIETDVLGNTFMHVWYCGNEKPAIIMDHIGYRRGVLNADGFWVFGDETFALSPSPDTWDSRHVCDPTVIKGSFQYHQVSYTYLMSFLGCTTEDYSNNETGIAVANSLEGPWIKVDTLNPLVPWARDLPSGTWGTGMPSLLTVDQLGKVLLFYQSSAVGIGLEKWDFSNLNQPILLGKTSLTNDGIKNPDGSNLRLAIADFAFDPIKGRLYVISRTNTRDPADITKTVVDSHGILAYIDGLSNMEDVSETLFSQQYTWNIVGYVGPEQTGFERNHNFGLVKDVYGNVYRSDQIMVVVSTGHHSWGNDNIFTYRLMGYTFTID